MSRPGNPPLRWKWSRSFKQKFKHDLLLAFFLSRPKRHERAPCQPWVTLTKPSWRSRRLTWRTLCHQQRPLLRSWSTSSSRWNQIKLTSFCTFSQSPHNLSGPVWCPELISWAHNLVLKTFLKIPFQLYRMASRNMTKQALLTRRPWRRTLSRPRRSSRWRNLHKSKKKTNVISNIYVKPNCILYR